MLPCMKNEMTNEKIPFLQNACNIGINLRVQVQESYNVTFVTNKEVSNEQSRHSTKKCDCSTIGIRSRLNGCDPKVAFIWLRCDNFSSSHLRIFDQITSARWSRIKSLLDSINIGRQGSDVKDFEDVASGGGTARCSMQSNNEVFKKASCESREVSSVHGESHVPKRGSPGK
jgi:hypothetical protein